MATHDTSSIAAKIKNVMIKLFNDGLVLDEKIKTKTTIIFTKGIAIKT